MIGEVGGKGELERAGTYPLTGKTSLLEVLSMAGGPSADAASK